MAGYCVSEAGHDVPRAHAAFVTDDDELLRALPPVQVQSYEGPFTFYVTW